MHCLCFACRNFKKTHNFSLPSVPPLYAPVTMASAAMQENAEMSMFMLCKLEENSTIASTHSPNPRTHCSLCNTTPLQKISFPSTGLDLQINEEKNAFNYARELERLVIANQDANKRQRQ